MFTLTKEYGSWYCRDGNNIIYMTDELAFAFSVDDEGCATMHKHGSEEKVNEWARNARKQYRECGFEELAGEIKVIASSEWDEETVNRFLNNSGYIGIYWKEQCKMFGDSFKEKVRD